MTSPIRFPLAALLLVTAVLAGCTTTTTDARGPVVAADASAAPEDEQVVVALDDFAALGALSLGVEPDLVLEAFDYASTTAVFADLGLETAPYGAELSLEQVAAADPDLILGVSLPTTAAVEEQLAAIAPTTVVDYTGTWEEQLDQVAAALGREAEAGEIARRLDDEAAALAADLEEAGLEGMVTSVVADNGGLFALPEASSVGSLLAAAGLARPAAQTAAPDPTAPFLTFSSELLADHDGDQLYLLSGGAYATEAIQASPLWPQLAAVQAGAVHEVSGEVWLASSPFAVDWVLRDLRATLLDGAPAATAEDAPARFEEFTAERP